MGDMDLERFCREFSSLLTAEPGMTKVIERGQELVAELASEPAWFFELLRKMILDREFLNAQRPSTYSNEITLYRGRDPHFSVLAYIWDSNVFSPIHDHSAWGLFGTILHPLRETKYRRVDDRTVENYAELEETSSRVISPGGVSYIPPLEEGIHQVGPETDQGALTVNVYGRSLRPGYTQVFYREQRTVHRAYSPNLLKKALAVRALGSIPEPWAEEILTCAAADPAPDSLRGEYEASLARLREISDTKNRGQA